MAEKEKEIVVMYKKIDENTIKYSVFRKNKNNPDNLREICFWCNKDYLIYVTKKLEIRNWKGEYKNKIKFIVIKLCLNCYRRLLKT